MQQSYNLPCLYYIIADIPENDEKRASAFSLAYIQYLEQLGITDPVEIEKKLTGISMFSQFSNVDRKTPLDFLSVGGNRYQLTDGKSFTEYKKALSTACSEPMSFSSLLKNTDPDLSLCHTCKYSSHYEGSMYEMELSLMRSALESEDSFKKISEQSLPELFRSWLDLFDILPKIRQPHAFPAFLCLANSIKAHTDDYFNGLFSGDYLMIRSDFITELSSFGIVQDACAGLEDYDKFIFEYLMDTIQNVSSHPDTDMDALIDKLLTREPYNPPFDADMTPYVSISSKQSEQSELDFLAASSTEQPAKPKRRRKKKPSRPEIEVTTADSQKLDRFINGIEEQPFHYSLPGPLEPSEKDDNMPTKLHTDLHTDLDMETETEKIDVTATDILSKDGDILSESHRIGLPLDETISYNADMGNLYQPDDDYDDDEDDEDEDAGASDGHITDTDSGNGMDTIEETAITRTNAIMDNDTGFQPPCPVLDQDDADRTANELPAPAPAKEPDTPETAFNILADASRIKQEDIADFKTIDTTSCMDRILSLSNNQGYCVAEPVVISGKDYLLLSANSQFFVSAADNRMLEPLLKKRDLPIVSLHPHALYGICIRHGLSLRNVYPLPDMIYLHHIQVVPFQTPKECIKQCIKLYGICLEKDTDTALLPKRSLLCEAYGYSFYRDRFLNMTADHRLLSYENCKPVCSAFKKRSTDTSVIPGRMVTVTFAHQAYSSTQYQELSEMIFMILSEKGIFRQMDISILGTEPDTFSLFIGDSCYLYLHTYIPSLLFETAYDAGMKNLHFDLTETKF